jgi:hypothetical protein
VSDVDKISTPKVMRDKHGTPVNVGDLVISHYQSSAGQIYRVKEITNAHELAPGEIQANCVRVFDLFLLPQSRGNFTTWGRDITKVDKDYISQMTKRWSDVSAML